jgi:mono/diheme cytochrome c family protein
MRLKGSGIALVTAAGLMAGGTAGAAAKAQAATGPGATPPAAAARSQGGNAAAVARGKYIVAAGGCNDCHTPWKMGANGPEPDMSLFLSGHPASMTLPPPPAPSGPWIMSATATNTAWAGPWGTSFTANLTPDPETGLGQWTEQQFIDTLRTGRRQGRGREILPPMPWPAFKNFNDADLKAIFAYLKTIPPIKNKVPDPVLAAPAK